MFLTRPLRAIESLFHPAFTLTPGTEHRFTLRLGPREAYPGRARKDHYHRDGRPWRKGEDWDLVEVLFDRPVPYWRRATGSEIPVLERVFSLQSKSDSIQQVLERFEEQVRSQRLILGAFGTAGSFVWPRRFQDHLN